MMSQGASLGVLLPTRNSVELLPAHLAAMDAWLDLADQVVVVDSFSTDLTESILRRTLHHPRLRFSSHPPGLYASWNAGVRQLSTDYVYISTVGDTITRDGLRKLLHTARTLDADVVISKPVFQRPDGQSVEIEWPIHDIIRTLGVTTPRRLQRWEAILFACIHATGALTGSCASDLFRTETLQRLPFPTEFGTAGDGIWSVRHAAQVSWAVLADTFSTFLLHPTGASQKENQRSTEAPRVDKILGAAIEQWVREGLVTHADLQQIQWPGLLSTLTAFLDEKTVFDGCRKAKWPWILNPRAWRARTIRGRSRIRLESLKLRALREPGAAVLVL